MVSYDVTISSLCTTAGGSRAKVSLHRRGSLFEIENQLKLIHFSVDTPSRIMPHLSALFSPERHSNTHNIPRCDVIIMTFCLQYVTAGDELSHDSEST